MRGMVMGMGMVMVMGRGGGHVMKEKDRGQGPSTHHLPVQRLASFSDRASHGLSSKLFFTWGWFLGRGAVVRNRHAGLNFEVSRLSSTGRQKVSHRWRKKSLFFF